jgi:DNA-binding transcriptional regulator YiaG
MRTDEEKTAITRWIRALRKTLDEDVDTFGARVARSGRTVEDWEFGRRQPDALVMQHLKLLEKRLTRKHKSS